MVKYIIQCSLEGMMLKLKFQYFGHLMWRVDSLEKTDAGRDCGQEEKGMTEDEMAGWHHWLYGHKSEWTPGDGDGQGGLACCDSWGRLSDWTELNWSRLVITFLPRSKRLLISWLQSPSAVILEPKKIKSDTLSSIFPSFAMKWWNRMPWSSFSECWPLSQLFTHFHFHQEAF